MDQEIYELKISDSFTPATLPMARLAEYLTEFARLLGHKEHVHFKSVTKGSARLRAYVDRAEQPKVAERLMLVKMEQSPADAVDAQRRLNDMLRNDNATGKLTRSGGDVVLQFPGRKTPLFEEVTVIEQGELDGVVIRVGGKDDSIPVWIKGEGVVVFRCTANETIAKELIRFYLGDPIRVTGDGKWRRTRDEGWRLDEFKIRSYTRIDQADLNDAIESLRAVEGSLWNTLEDPIAEWRKLRGE